MFWSVTGSGNGFDSWIPRFRGVTWLMHSILKKEKLGGECRMAHEHPLHTAVNTPPHTQPQHSASGRISTATYHGCRERSTSCRTGRSEKARQVRVLTVVAVSTVSYGRDWAGLDRTVVMNIGCMEEVESSQRSFSFPRLRRWGVSMFRVDGSVMCCRYPS